jgi:hypothetical protein
MPLLHHEVLYTDTLVVQSKTAIAPPFPEHSSTIDGSAIPIFVKAMWSAYLLNLTETIYNC